MMLILGLPITQIKRLQHIQNGLASVVIRIPKHSHISSVLKSLHLLKVEHGFNIRSSPLHTTSYI